MSIENQMPQIKNNEELLNSEEAQQEANMMRVKIAEMIGHEPTAEDYENALTAVEEMKDAAENETETDNEKRAIKVLQVGAKYWSKGIDLLYKTITLGLGKQKIEEDDDAYLHMFDTAKQRLELLKKKAEKLK